MRKAFTLVELLVVIGIIVLLISILMPALRSAWDSAKTIRCAANLRNVYQAMAAFRAEVAGFVAAGRVREVEHRLVGESARCLGDLVTQAERGADGDPVMSMVVCWAVEEVLAALKPQLKGHSKSVTRIGDRVGLLRTGLEARLAVENATDSEFGRFLSWARAEFVGRGAR